MSSLQTFRYILELVRGAVGVLSLKTVMYVYRGLFHVPASGFGVS